MDAAKKEQLIKIIKDTLEANDYCFRNREDFCESRFSWESLADAANSFYYTIGEIERLLNNEPPTLKCPQCGSCTDRQHRYGNGEQWICPACYIGLCCDHTPQTKWANEK